MISVSNHFEIGIGWSVRSLFLHDHCAENFEKRKVVAINEEASSFYRTTLAWTWSTALFVIIFKVNLMLFLLRSSMRYFLTTTVIQVILRKQSWLLAVNLGPKLTCLVLQTTRLSIKKNHNRNVKTWTQQRQPINSHPNLLKHHFNNHQAGATPNIACCWRPIPTSTQFVKVSYISRATQKERGQKEHCK